MDVLSGIVEAAKARVDLGQTKDYRGAFTEFCSGRNFNIYFIEYGTCSISLDGQEDPSIHLESGDLLILARRQNHQLHSSPGNSGDENQRVRVVRGKLSSHESGSEAIYECLPPVLVINLLSEAALDSVKNVMRVCSAHDDDIGGRSILSRLAELLVLIEARNRVKSEPDTIPGWMGIFAEPKIGRALRAIQLSPTESWTLERLAKEAGMSRTTFSQRFTEVVGEPPMTYVTRWRMQIAIDLLRTETPIGSISSMVGYATEAAFSKAFRREVGVSPSAYARVAAQSEREHRERNGMGQRAIQKPSPTADSNRSVELNKIAIELERLAPPARCSILLLNEQEQKLYVGAAPSLPESYNQTINGIPIGPRSGSCGTAVHLKRPVVTRDIFGSDLWADYRYLAERYDFRACWSNPILSDNGSVMGTFAVYYSDFHEPNGAELGLIDHMSRRVKTLLQG